MLFLSSACVAAKTEEVIGERRQSATSHSSGDFGNRRDCLKCRRREGGGAGTFAVGGVVAVRLERAVAPEEFKFLGSVSVKFERDAVEFAKMMLFILTEGGEAGLLLTLSKSRQVALTRR